jgi:hypothetical protein
MYLSGGRRVDILYFGSLKVGDSLQLQQLQEEQLYGLSDIEEKSQVYSLSLYIWAYPKRFDGVSYHVGDQDS